MIMCIGKMVAGDKDGDRYRFGFRLGKENSIVNLTMDERKRVTAMKMKNKLYKYIGCSKIQMRVFWSVLSLVLSSV